MTSAEIDELVALAQATSEAAERAGAVSRVRHVDIALVSVKENADRLAARAREMAVRDTTVSR